MIKKKFYLIVLLFLLVVPVVFAIRINEIESNPEGTDARNEWVELYSKEEIDLEDYKLVNNDGDEIILNGSFSEYYIYTFNKQWLDNSDEKVFLYKNNELLDETELFEDTQNNDKTWQLCGSWEFIESTKGKENNCEEEIKDETPKSILEEPEETQENNSYQEELIPTEFNSVETPEEESENIEPEIIKLNTKNIKSENDKEDLDKNNYAIYGFVVFCVLLCFLFVLKRNRFNKNEFG